MRLFPAARRPDGPAAPSRGAHLPWRPALLFLALALVWAALSGARCYPPNTRVVIFIQGIYSTYDEDGTQASVLEEHRFDALKDAFAERGYAPGKLADFSYAGGEPAIDGSWQPKPYPCARTDRPAAEHVATLEEMLRQYRARHHDAHFTLVGHSLGGYVAFLAGAREAARPDADKLGIDVVVTMDAPIKGVSPDKKIILDFVQCEKTYLAGAELVAARQDPTTPQVRLYQSVVMAQQGVRLATLGNVNDCLWNPAACIGGDWANDGDTQFLDGQAALSKAYALQTDPLSSHDAILVDPAAIADAVAFVGAP